MVSHSTHRKEAQLGTCQLDSRSPDPMLTVRILHSELRIALHAKHIATEASLAHWLGKRVDFIPTAWKTAVGETQQSSSAMAFCLHRDHEV